MKYFSLLLVAVLLLVSCNEDSDDTVAICETPTNITISDISFETAIVTWQNENDTSSFVIEYGPSGFNIGSGMTAASDVTTLTLSGLTPDTIYDVYIKAFCGVDNESILSQAVSFTTAVAPVIPQFLQNLSDLNLFQGDLDELNPSIYTFEYEPSSKFFSDYAYKQRIVALPNGEKMTYIGNDLLPRFPDNTLIAKTFFYYNNENNITQGRQIIETRILIKVNGVWESGNYKWNAEQTDAVLDRTESIVEINYVNFDGENQTVNYKIPDDNACLICHGNNSQLSPIGIKFRSLNYDNQLQDLIDNNHVDGLTDASTVSSMPNYNDTSQTLENRARAYFDINCAYCHSPGGFCEVQSDLRLSYETPFDDTAIYERRISIDMRMGTYIDGFTMPYIGTSMVHTEGYDLIRTYLESLE